MSAIRTHSRVVSWLLISILSMWRASRLWAPFNSCITDLFFFSVIVKEAYGFRSVVEAKSESLSLGGAPVIVDNCDLKASRGRVIVLAVNPRGDFWGYSRYPKSLGRM